MKITFKIETPGDEAPRTETACELAFVPTHLKFRGAQAALLKAFNGFVDLDTANAPTCHEIWMDGCNDMKKLNAIKAVRTVTGLGLREANDLVKGPFPKMLRDCVTGFEMLHTARALDEGEITWRAVEMRVGS
jgi:hypothetical protein